ncbi:PP2C family protein-serine/threonine phosphatase [Megalodesulfovibrio paquesii]
MYACAATRTGPKHGCNQDAWNICEQVAPGLSLFLVSDGVGGRAAGEVASQYVVKALPALLRRELREEKVLLHAGAHACGEAVSHCVRRVSRHLRIHAMRQPTLAGMSATLALLLIHGDEALVAHLGDSRIYRLRDTVLTSLTDDHTLTANLVSMGDLRSSQVFRHPGRHQLMRCLGMHRDPAPDIAMVHCQPGDRFLLCTDGVSKPLGDETLRQLLLRDGLPETIAHGLLAEVDRRNGTDDATALLVCL